MIPRRRDGLDDRSGEGDAARRGGRGQGAKDRRGNLAMSTSHASIVINRSEVRVFDFVSHIGRAAQWVTGTVETRKVSGDFLFKSAAP